MDDPVTTGNRQQSDIALLSPLTPEGLGEIVAAAADISLLVSSSLVVALAKANPQNGLAARIADWHGAPVQTIFAPESWAKLKRRLDEMAAGKSLAGISLELNHADRGLWEFPVRYTLHPVGSDGSVLMMGRDLRAIAEVQQQLVTAQLALERDYETQRDMETRYRVLMEVGRDPMLIVSMSTGRIADVNAAAASLLGAPRTDLMGAAIAQEFDGRRRGEFLESMANLAVSESAAPIELTARRSQRRVSVTPSMFRAGGERLLLCQVDLAEGQNPAADELAVNLLRMFNEGVDGMVFTDGDGAIKAANEAFLNLTDSASMALVRGKSLGDFMVRGAVDLRVLLDNVKRTGQMRMYATKLVTDYSGQIAVELSATWLNDRPNPALAVVVRDASRAESMRRSAAAPNDTGIRNVMELVGATALKEIVAETTDVIEKMCIETALELTRNNRVAAAEMLSLSRQSLYVKLRKFGLLNKDGE